MGKVYILTRIDTDKGFNPEYAKAFRNKWDAISQMEVEFFETRRNPKYAEENAHCDGDNVIHGLLMWGVQIILCRYHPIWC